MVRGSGEPFKCSRKILTRGSDRGFSRVVSRFSGEISRGPSLEYLSHLTYLGKGGVNVVSESVSYERH